MFDPKFIQFQIRKFKGRLKEHEATGNYELAMKCAKQLEALQRRLHLNMVIYHKELKVIEESRILAKQRNEEMMAWFGHMTTYDSSKKPSDIRGYVLINQHHAIDIISDFTAIDDCKDLLIEGKLHPLINPTKSIPIGYFFYAILNNGIMKMIGENVDSGD